MLWLEPNSTVLQGQMWIKMGKDVSLHVVCLQVFVKVSHAACCFVMFCRQSHVLVSDFICSDDVVQVFQGKSMIMSLTNNQCNNQCYMQK